MSWYINIIGSPGEIKQAVDKDAYIPVALKDLVTLYVEANKKATEPQKLHLRTGGHYWPDGPCWIESFSLTQPPISAPPLVAVSSEPTS